MRASILFIVAASLAIPCIAADTPGFEALLGSNGSLHLQKNGKDLCAFNASAYDKGWAIAGAVAAGHDVKENDPGRKFTIKTGGAKIGGECSVTEKDGTLSASYSFTTDKDVALNSLYAGAEFSIGTLAGEKWTADDKSGIFPHEFKEVGLFNGRVSRLNIVLSNGADLNFTFPAPVSVLLQDNRKWSQQFVIRIGALGEVQLKKGADLKFAFALSANAPIALSYDLPVTIVEGPDWTPLKLDLEIEAGSALDFSKMGLQDAPAGKYGRVVARPDGQFAFEANPDITRRFYGINLCFGANYITHDESDKLAERLARLGYNAVRIHHYESELAQKQPDSLTFNPDKIDRLDYLLAALSKQGIYVTTDLFVSRHINARELGMENLKRDIEMDEYKVLVPIHNGAWENWKSFTKALLGHENQYSKKRYADDAALAWLSMINEGSYGNFMKYIVKIPEWKTAWNEWLAKRYAARSDLASAWGKELKDDDDAAKGNITLPENIYAGGMRVRDCVEFLDQKERENAERMRKFVKEEIGCKALLTNNNAWTNHATLQATRDVYDYVDDHFYIDHPEFIERPWNLPSRCKNSSPISEGAAGGRTTTFTRLFDKPFTITEFNYAGPGRFRGVGGILTGAMGALQGWGGIWRFAYSHSENGMFVPGRMEYFNMANDPLSQAAERACFCLYLRGDMKMAPHSAAIVMTKEDLAAPPKQNIPWLAPNWHWLAWVTRVGTQVVSDPATKLNHTAVLPVNWATPPAAYTNSALIDVAPYSATNANLLAMLHERFLFKGTPADPEKSVFRSETGEITIDAPRNMLILDTPRTAGGYAPAGQRIATGDKTVILGILGADATVFINALDEKPIAESSRLLLTHLTDLQNTKIRYAEKARQTLLDWGGLPHLVRNGSAQVRIKLNEPDKYKVYALFTSGKRMGEVPVAVTDGYLEFTADVAGGAKDDGARMLYEIAR